MSPHMRRRQLQRQQEQVVQLEVAGHDMPVPPKRQSVCESPTTPQLPRTPDPESTGLLRAQEKYGQQSSHDIHAKVGLIISCYTTFACVVGKLVLRTLYYVIILIVVFFYNKINDDDTE